MAHAAQVEPQGLAEAGLDKPRWRGVSHHVAFIVAIPGFLALVLSATGKVATTVAVIYGVPLMMLFGISALYHRRMWKPRARALMRRLDHAGIFVFIAASYTPLCMFGLPEGEGRALLWAAWIVAALGTLHAVFFVHAFRTLNAVLFVVMGCALIPYMPVLATRIGWGCLTLLAAGGAIYIAGAVVYARRWPNPNPAVFGYHEVFHLMVIAATALQYAAMLVLVRNAG